MRKRQFETGNEASLVAELIAPAAAAEAVSCVVDCSNEQLLMMHGIKRAASIDGALKQGILPLAPEGGPGSFWATGWRIFCSGRPTRADPDWTYDTPFFHYAHAASDDGIKRMALAVTDPSRLENIQVPVIGIGKDEQCVVQQPVPPNSLTLVVVEQVAGEPLQHTALTFLASCAVSGLLRQPGLLTNV